MTTEEFIYQAKRIIYKNNAKNLNQLLGHSKTASVASHIFLKLPIDVSVEQADTTLDKVERTAKSLFSRLGAYVVVGNVNMIYMTFAINDEKDFPMLLKVIEQESVVLTCTYLHELFHVVRKHNTKTFDNMMHNIIKNHPNGINHKTSQTHQLINIAEDYAINYAIKNIIDNSPLAKVDNFTPNVLYKTEYHTHKLSEMDILKELLNKMEQPQVTQVSKSMQSVAYGSQTVNQPTPEAGQDGEPSDGEGENDNDSKPSVKGSKGEQTQAEVNEEMANNLAENLKQALEEATKGTESAQYFSEAFGSIPINTGWFKKLAATFKRQVYYKTHNYTTSWSNMNNVYRRIFKSPKKNFIDDAIELILSVDHSGSMRTEDLQRLLYLLETESKRIQKLTVLIHDTAIVKEFKIENEFDIQKHPDFKNLSHRYAVGGTSHKCVFKWIQDNVKDDLEKKMFISFSDNYSDIKKTFKHFPTMKKITSIFLCTENNPMKVPGTTDIQMQ